MSDPKVSARTASLVATIAMIGAVGAPLGGVAQTRHHDKCPQCKRGKVKLRVGTMYCHRCGWFVTGETVSAVLAVK